MFHNRKALTAIGLTAAAVAGTAFLAAPAQAASAGLAKVIGSSTVDFRALMGKSNALTITISGRTVTLDDKVAIKAGHGCKAVRNDRTKVKCTTSAATKKVSVSLGDKNDSVTNKTPVFLLANGGTGDDTLTGGDGKDELQGAAGNDKLYGRGGNDTIFGEAGNDRIDGGAGNDRADAGAGDDRVWGAAGNDQILAGAGKDWVSAGAGDDVVEGGTQDDTLFGEAGKDVLVGEAGNDRIDGGAGDDSVHGEAGIDRLYGGAGKDIILGGAGNDWIAAGADDDIAFGLAGDDRIYGEAGNDFLAGENLSDSGAQVGSDSARDALDGGAQTQDFCLVMAGGTTVNCELGQTPATAGLSLPAAAAVRVRSEVHAPLGRVTAQRIG